MMSDPLADLSNNPGGGLDGDATSSGDGNNNNTSREIVDGIALFNNLSRIDRIRSIMGIVSGVVVGITGISGLQGFVYFVLFHILVSVVIWVWKMNCDLKSYTRQTWMKYLMASSDSCLLSFTLFWTLFYGLVYLY